ncbi:MAG: DUF4870 domain-containing protein [Anaerolineales bacterium]|nr:DUF4870 domain-containing protein [Anaerolineales bacterium]
MTEQPLNPEITQDDKLWAALGYPIPLVALIVLFMDEKKARPFIKFHAVQSLVFNVALWILIFIISAVTLGIGAICAPVLWLISLWPAYEAYQGKYLEMPVITDFMKKQGWV